MLRSTNSTYRWRATSGDQRGVATCWHSARLAATTRRWPSDTNHCAVRCCNAADRNTYTDNATCDSDNGDNINQSNNDNNDSNNDGR